MKAIAPSSAAIALLAAALIVPPLAAASEKTHAEPKSEKSEKKKKKAKNNPKPASSHKHTNPAKDSKEALAEIIGPIPGIKPDKDFNLCKWLDHDPGLLFEDKKNPWISSFEIGGRFQYQAAYVDGNDVNGRDYHDAYDEYRRLRLESKTEFLKYLTAEINLNLVDDNRFRDGGHQDVSWGYDRFDEASLEFDIGKAFGDGFLDGIKLKYGRMKLKMSEEAHQSSKEIYTIERSTLSDRLGGEEGRPTGVTLELDKADWELTLGVFSGEDDADFLGGWNDGEFYYASLEWKPDDDLTFRLDYSQNDRSGADDSLGYSWAGALSAHYDKKEWGFITEAVYGDNGSAPDLIERRQGNFTGFVVMPWYWIIEDKLQAVVRYEYGSSSELQGLQTTSRYLRAAHDDLLVDDDNGRGHQLNSIYFGLNYHFCPDKLKIMGGISYDDLDTRESNVRTMTYEVAFRAAF